MNRIFCIIMLLLLASTVTIFSENIYIRADSKGNNSGTDWSNALTSLPWRYDWVRGNTYYIADGDYDSGTQDYFDCRTAENGSEYITIKKATEVDHGTDEGWNSSYGDGVALFLAPIWFNTSYWIFDGVTGVDNGAIEPYGFKVYNSSQSSAGSLVYITGGVRFVTVQHVEMEQSGTGIEAKQNCFYAVDPTPSYPTDWVLRNCYMHAVSQVHMLVHGGARSIVENNYFADRVRGSYGIHGEAISWNNAGSNANIHIRYNKVVDVEGTGLFVIKDSVQSHFFIYGNLFVNGSDFSASNAAICNTAGDTNSHMYVFNNTFVNIQGSAGVMWDSGSNNYSYNNLWYSCENVFFNNTEHDYNSFYSNDKITSENESGSMIANADPFVNSIGSNFHLIAGNDKGMDLSSYNAMDIGIATFDVDIEGNKRNNWSKGAYEYNPFGDDLNAIPFGIRIKQ